MGAGTLLLVDDQPDNLLACKALLSADLPGCQVIATTDPEEALGAARAAPIDVALVDVCMPTVSGIEVHRGFLLDNLRSITMIPDVFRQER